MFTKNYPSQLLEEAVEQFASLPGIGRKSALRLALHILKQPVENVERFSRAFTELRRGVKYCKQCNMITDGDYCPICRDGKRDSSVICVVESIRDVLSIENTGHYNGLYHVLGGIISPIDGVGPSDLPIEHKKLSGLNVRITANARGVGFGDDLEYADELTLGKSIENRQLFKY